MVGINEYINRKEMNFFEKLKSFNNALNNKEREIVQTLFIIDPSIVDNDKSSINNTRNFYFVNLFSKNNLCCPITIGLGKEENENRVSFYFNEARILVEKDVSDELELKEIVDSIKKLLRSEVQEELIYVRGKIAESKYLYSINIDSNKIIVPYRGYNGLLSFIGKRKIIHNNYQPWNRPSRPIDKYL